MNRTRSEIIVPIKKSAHAPGNFNCRQAGRMLDVHQEVYLHDYQTVPAARAQLSEYFEFYNTEQPHEALGYRTPHEVYFGTRSVLAQASAAMV